MIIWWINSVKIKGCFLKVRGGALSERPWYKRGNIISRTARAVSLIQVFGKVNAPCWSAILHQSDAAVIFQLELPCQVRAHHPQVKNNWGKFIRTILVDLSFNLDLYIHSLSNLFKKLTSPTCRTGFRDHNGQLQVCFGTMGFAHANPLVSPCNLPTLPSWHRVTFHKGREGVDTYHCIRLQKTLEFDPTLRNCSHQHPAYHRDLLPLQNLYDNIAFEAPMQRRSCVCTICF